MRALVAAMTLVAVTGCSFTFVRPAPRVDTGARPADCTTSRVAPIVDAVPAAAAVGGGIAALLADDDGADGASFQVPIAIGLFALATPFAISSIVGFRRTAKCNALNATAVPSPAS
jgi:hypothetical protein